MGFLPRNGAWEALESVDGIVVYLSFHPLNQDSTENPDPETED